MPADEMDDLVRRSRAGDPDAFDRLVGRYYGITFGLAFRMLGSRETAEDACQEIFIRAWRGLPRFRGGARFSTWLHTIAVNHCLDTARRMARDARRSRPLFEDEELMHGRSPGPEAVPFAADCDRRLAVREALGRLSEKLQVVVTLRYYAGYTLDEIAQALGLPLNTVRSRLALAMKRLRNDLGDLKELP